MDDNYYPCLYQSSDKASIAAQARYLLKRRAELVLLIIGAALGGYLISSPLPEPFTVVPQGLALLAAVVLIATILLEVLLAFGTDDDVWYAARAVAESVKTATWRYMMKASPYEDDAGANGQFLADVETIKNAQPIIGAAIAKFPVDAPQLTAAMKDNRQLDLSAKVALYRQGRIREQKLWYQNRASENASSQGRMSLATGAVQALAIVLALVYVARPYTSYNFLGLLTTVSVSLIAWTELKRHTELSHSYALAGQDLASFEAALDDVHAEDQLAELVANAENAISREHVMWYVKRA